ncbi:MAG: hypothetical protein ABRQ38_12555 [Candidatus Eremiobacterota bacterium]
MATIFSEHIHDIISVNLPEEKEEIYNHKDFSREYGCFYENETGHRSDTHERKGMGAMNVPVNDNTDKITYINHIANQVLILCDINPLLVDQMIMKQDIPGQLPPGISESPMMLQNIVQKLHMLQINIINKDNTLPEQIKVKARIAQQIGDQALIAPEIARLWKVFLE